MVTMSDKELQRLQVVQSLTEKRLCQKEAAASLCLSVRHVRRLVCAYRRQGAPGLTSRRRGKPSNRRIADSERDYFLSLIRQHYSDFGPTLAAEYLRERYGFTRSVETLRRWMSEAGIWRSRARRRVRSHPPRARRPRFGELVQVDGSLHDWFEGRGARCSLIAFIDDATSRLVYARFEPLESTSAYLRALQTYVETHGLPVSIYSDRHSIFTKHDAEDFEPTQFERALKDLKIESIQAATPQAKGRVERVFQTLQDRLVKAMRLAGISSRKEGNAFLADYLKAHNGRFAICARICEDAHEPYIGTATELSRYCSLHYRRTLSKDLVLSFKAQRYIVQTEGAQRYDLQRKRITVCQHTDGRVELLNSEQSLPYRIFGVEKERAEAADEKTLEVRVDAAVKKARLRVQRPDKKHPWKRSYKPS